MPHYSLRPQQQANQQPINVTHVNNIRLRLIISLVKEQSDSLITMVDFF